MWKMEMETVSVVIVIGVIKKGQEKYVNRIGHFTVVYGSETEGDLVLIQTFLLFYVNQVILMLTIIFQEQFP